MRNTTFLPILILGTVLTYMTWTNPTDVHAQAGAIVEFSPQNQTVKQGETLSTTILVNTQGETIRRVFLEITYPRNVLTARSLDQTSSILGIWYQQNLNTPGKITLEGEVPGAGASGDGLIVTKINFDTLKDSDATLAFAASSKVLRASDNANILIEARSVTYFVSSVTPTPVPTFGGPTPAVSQTPLPTSGQATSVVTATPTPPPTSGQATASSTPPTSTILPSVAMTATPPETPTVALDPDAADTNRGSIQTMLLVAVISLVVGGGIGVGVYYWLKKPKQPPSKPQIASPTTTEPATALTDENIPD